MPPNSGHRSHHPERSAAKSSAVPEKRPRGISDQPSLAGKNSKDNEVDGPGKKVMDKNSERVRVPVVNCKDRSSQNRTVKHGPEKDAGRKEIRGQCKVGKDRDRDRESEKSKAARGDVLGKERGTEKGGSEVKQAKKSTGVSEKDRVAEKGVSQVKHAGKKDKENTECHKQNELHHPQLDKELERRAKGRDISDNKGKLQEDIRESDDRQYRESFDKQLSSSDERRRSGCIRNGSHSRDKPSGIDHRDHDGGPYEDWTNSRGQRDRKRPYDEYEVHRDLRLRGRKHPCVDVEVDSHIMEDKFTERYLKKSKLQGSDNYDDQFIEEERKVCRDNRGRKRSLEGDDYHRDVKFRCKKQPRGDVETSSLNTTRSNQRESIQRAERTFQEKYYSSSTSRGDFSGFCKREQKDHTDGSVRETVADQKYDRNAESDSPVKYDTDLVRSRQKEGRGGNTIPVSLSFSSRGGSCGRPPRPMKRQINGHADMGSFKHDNTFQSGDHSTGMSPGNAWRSTSPNTNFLVSFQHHSSPPFHSALGQFPTPFGVSQPMNMNPTGIFPFGYGHVDVTSQFQYWSGHNNLSPWNPHNYWLANQNRMGNEEPERNPSMWNGPNNNDNMDSAPQETEYTTKPLVPDEFDVKLNHGSQSEQAQQEAVPDEKIKAKHSDVTSRKNAEETLPKNMSKKTDKPKICHVKSYLSKLDISSDLIPPELYNRCLTLLESRDADAETNSKQVKEATKATSKTSTHLSSLFPKTKDAIFERTVSLCKKQNEARELNLPVLNILLKDYNNPPEGSNMEEAKKNFSEEISQEDSDSRIMKALVDQASGEMLKASADQASVEMLGATNAEIVIPLVDPASGEILEASKAETVKLLADLDASNVYIVKPLTDQALPEISEASKADVVKTLIDQALGEMSETNVSATTDSEDELYTGLDIVFTGEAMEPQSVVTFGATVIA